MKSKLIFTFIFASPIFLAVGVFASHPWIGKTLTSEQVKKRWGNSEFNEKSFKDADVPLRATMASSLMTSKQLLGLTASQVRERLGSFDGHYFSASYPTYLIQRAEKKGEESWQIVFLIDGNKKTKNIIVHKNCCD